MNHGEVSFFRQNSKTVCAVTFASKDSHRRRCCEFLYIAKTSPSSSHKKIFKLTSQTLCEFCFLFSNIAVLLCFIQACYEFWVLFTLSLLVRCVARRRHVQEEESSSSSFLSRRESKFLKSHVCRLMHIVLCASCLWILVRGEKWKNISVLFYPTWNKWIFSIQRHHIDIERQAKIYFLRRTRSLSLAS